MQYHCVQPGPTNQLATYFHSYIAAKVNTLKNY